MTSTQAFRPPTRGSAVPPTPPAWTGAVAGLVGCSGALAAGELVGRLLTPKTPPLVALGDAVVATTPPGVRDWAIETFGTNDKPVLLASVAGVVLGIAVLVGLRARRRPRTGEAMVAVLAAVPLLAGATRTGTISLSAVVTSLAMAVTGIALLRVLLGLRLRSLDPTPVAPKDWSRRAFLIRSGAVVVVTAAAGSVARWLDTRVDINAIRALRTLRAPVRPAPGNPVTAALDVQGISPLITPAASFYRIDTALIVPRIDPAHWKVTVKGRVDREVSLTYDDLMAMPQFEADITLQCVSNEVGGDLVGNARWQGVLLSQVLEMAGVQAGADQVVGRSVDGFTAGFPTAAALDGRPAMIALGMNGEPLLADHGFPARLVVPGLYGYVSATKWLSSIELRTMDEFDGFWVPRGWAKQAPIKPSSRIDVPQDLTRVVAGDVVVAGVAWAPGPGRGVQRVEVQVDDGAWAEAELGGALSDDAWRQWRHTAALAPGEHLLAVRTTERGGTVQTAERADQRPDGATGYHYVRVLAE